MDMLNLEGWQQVMMVRGTQPLTKMYAFGIVSIFRRHHWAQVKIRNHEEVTLAYWTV